MALDYSFNMCHYLGETDLSVTRFHDIWAEMLVY